MVVAKIILPDSSEEESAVREIAEISFNADQSENIVPLDDSNLTEQDADGSIIFVCESTATVEMRKQKKKNEKIFELRKKNRELKNQVQQLMSNQCAPDDDDVVIVQPNFDNAIPASQASDNSDNDGDGDVELMDLDVYNEEFINKELEQWHANGELPKIFEEFQQFLKNLF